MQYRLLAFMFYCYFEITVKQSPSRVKMKNFYEKTKPICDFQ